MVDSSQSISWHAHREAERLSDSELLPELQSFVTSARSKTERKSAYFILGSLGANTGDTGCALLLVERLQVEQDKYVVAAVLDALGKIEKSADFPLGPVFDRMLDERWLVRHAAIGALKGSNSPTVEERLLQHLRSTEDPYDIVHCQATLGKVGTTKSLPALQANLSSRKRDVKDSAKMAMEAICSRLSVPSATTMPNPTFQRTATRPLN